MKIKGQKKLSISIVVIILLLIIIAAEIIVNTETKADYSGTTSDNLFEYTVATEQAEPATNEVLDLTDLINEYLYKGTLNLVKTTTKAYEMVQAFVSAKEGEQC